MIYAIRRVGPYSYDVFQGNQWNEWSRVRQGRSSTFVTAGQPLPYQTLKELSKVLAPTMPINYNQPHDTTLNHCFNIIK